MDFNTVTGQIRMITNITSLGTIKISINLVLIDLVSRVVFSVVREVRTVYVFLTTIPKRRCYFNDEPKKDLIFNRIKLFNLFSIYYFIKQC